MDQAEIRMEIDTGATMSEATYKGLWETNFRPKLQSSTARLSTYTGECIDVLGQITGGEAEYRTTGRVQCLLSLRSLDSVDAFLCLSVSYVLASPSGL